MKPLLLLISCVLCGLTSQAQGDMQLIDKIVAIIGDEIVLYSDLQAAEMELTKGQGKLTPEQQCMLIEDQAYQKLLLHHAKLDSVTVSDEEVNAQVERRLSYFMNMFGSAEQFEAYYGKSVAQMKEEYFDLIKDQLLVQKQQGEITRNVKTTPADVLRFYQSLPADSLPLIGEQVSYSKIVVDPVIRETARQRIINFLDSIRQDIVAGRTSMTLQAARHSEDPGSRYKGGCYPLQSRGVFVPPYEAAVFNTPEGEYSPVFETEYGYHFVKVVEKRGDYYEACHILMSPKVSVTDFDAARIKADSLHKEIIAGRLKFSEGAIRFSTDKDTRNQEGRVTNPRSGFRFDVAELPAELNLILRGMEPGAVSDPVLNTDPDGKQSYVVYRLDNRLPAHRANLEQDYEIFQSQAEAREKQSETDKWVKSKLQWTYVSFSEEYHNCAFNFEWMKSSK